MYTILGILGFLATVGMLGDLLGDGRPTIQINTVSVHDRNDDDLEATVEVATDFRRNIVIR